MKRFRETTPTSNTEEQGNVLYVGNVPEDATEEEIMKIFSKFNPTKVWISTQTRRSTTANEAKKFAFVTVASLSDLDSAISSRTPLLIRGNQMYATISHSKPLNCSICGTIIHSSELTRHIQLIHSEESQHNLEVSKTISIPENDSNFHKLNQELLQRLTDLLPTEAILKQRAEIGKSLEKIISAFWTKSKLIPFGSFQTGLSFANDDIDFSLIIRLTDAKTGEPWTEKGILFGLRRNLIQSGKFPMKNGQLALLLDARVPVMAFEPSTNHNSNPLFQIPFDICINRTLGILNSQLISDYLKCDTRVKPFLSLLKCWSKTPGRGVYGSKSGRLSSYSLCLMAVYFLQHATILPNLQDSKLHELDKGEVSMEGIECKWINPDFFIERSKGNNDDERNVILLLLGFFKFYGCEFDFKKNAISIKSGTIPRNELGFESQLQKLPGFCVLDPFEVSFNTAKQINQESADEIKSAFRETLVKIFEFLSRDDISSAMNFIISTSQ